MVSYSLNPIHHITQLRNRVDIARRSLPAPHNSQVSAPIPNRNGIGQEAIYASPHLVRAFQQQQVFGPPAQDPSYYASHASPRSAHSRSGQYTPLGEFLAGPSQDSPKRTMTSKHRSDVEADSADPMTTSAHMERPYPPIYHNPQSNSPTSVASPHSAHDQHGRSRYAQQAPQLTHPMYNYSQYPPVNRIHHSPYASQHVQHPHQMTSQPMIHQIPSAQSYPRNLAHQSNRASSPGMKMELPQQPYSSQQARGSMKVPQPQQQTPQSATTPTLHRGQTPGSGGGNSRAAPGPIPARTPLLIRQDGNGVQWIAFEYSRDRMKMEYTIRCDVESVNVDSLSQEFKTENRVYPRACCGKDH